ncbi:MAG: sugar transferase [Blastocatellia bacterium]
MTSTRWSALSRTQKILDVALLLLAFYLSFVVRGQISPLAIERIMTLTTGDGFWFALLLLGWYVCLTSLWIYRSRRILKWHDELTDVTRAVSLATVVLAGITVLAEWTLVNRTALIGFWLLALEVLFTVRLLKRLVMQHIRRRGINPRHVLLVGAGPRGHDVAGMLEKHPELGYRIIGFVDDDDMDIAAYPRTGGIRQMADILANNVVDEIIITLPIKSFYEEISTIIRIAEDQGVLVRIHSDLFNRRLARSFAEQFDEIPMLTLYMSERTEWMIEIKRVIDVIGSSLLLLAVGLLMLLIAMAIRLTSRGPAIFFQERVGFNKRRFKMYKFRTMVVDAEKRMAEIEHLNEAQGPVFKIKNDPRLTSIGGFLRKTSLDELPQFINVLKGDLSLVGPRPMSVRDFERFDEYWFNRRFSVRPGITCLWQVNGRSNTSFDYWIQQDLDYIDNWSLALDLKILFMTIPAVIRGNGAM